MQKLERRDGVVGVATGYGLGGPGIKFSQGQEIFSSPESSRPAQGPTQLGFFPGGG